MNFKITACCLFGVALAAGCQDSLVATSDEPEPQIPETLTGPLSVGPERSAVIADHAVLAFRPQGSAIVGGYRTHRSVVRDGQIEFTGYSYKGTERSAHAPITLETTAITIDDGLLGGSVTSTTIDNGTAVLNRDGVEERLRNELDGLHQEWHFEAAPALGGDLRVEVTVFGAAYTSVTDAGLHFVSRDGLGFRYSHAIWIGADGREWPIVATHDEGRIRMTVPESVVAQTQFPATLDPTVSAEVAADVPVAAPTGANAQTPAVAFNGTHYLVVWSDNRDSSNSDIWATRVSAAGAILDPLGIAVATTAGRQAAPTVTAAGSTFVVAWEDYKVAGGTESDIVAASVSASGAVTSLGTIGGGAANQVLPVSAGRSGNAIVVWNAAGTLQAAVFNGGTFGAAFTVATGALAEKPGVASNPAGNYLVAWSAASDLFGQFVTSGGSLSGGSFTISAANGTQYSPSASFDGTNFDVVWANNFSGINVYGARVSTAGVTLDTRTEGMAIVGGVPISTAPDSQETPSITCIASGCLVAWQDRRNLASNSYDIYGQLLTSTFSLNGGEFQISAVTGQQTAPQVASSGAGHYVVWQDLRDNAVLMVYGRTVSTGGGLGTDTPLVAGNNRESTPTLGRAGNVFGVFWSDSRAVGNDIRYVRFNGSGSKLDSTSLTASSANFAQINPSASTDLGGNSLVVWSDTRNGVDKDIYGARVAVASGTVVDGAGFAITTATRDQLLPDVASNGSVALVVWGDRRSNVSFDIYGALISSAGTVAVADIAISTASGDQVAPSVTWDAASSQFIVVWQDQRTPGVNHIYGTRVSSAGAVLDASGVLVGDGPVGQLAPAIASTSSNSFAVWQDRRNTGRYNIYGTRLTGGASLSVLDPAGIAVSTVVSRQSQPAITSIGTSYVVVWADDRAGQSDIYGQQLSSTGAPVEPEFVVSATPDFESAPTLASLAGTGTSVRVAYETARLGTLRVSSRLITTQSTPGSVCSGPSQCGTGFCVDGYCCDQACGGNHVPAGPKGSAVAGDCHGCASKFTNQPNGTCAPVSAGTICRDYVSTFCDLQELCDGTSMSCGPDVGRREGLTCNLNTNFPPGVGAGVCPAVSPAGAPHACL